MNFWSSVSPQPAVLFSIHGRAVRRDHSATTRGVGKYNLSQEDKCLQNYFMERKGSEKQLSPCLQVCGGLLLERTSQPAPGEEALPLEKLGAIAVANPGLDLSRDDEGKTGGCCHGPDG